MEIARHWRLNPQRYGLVGEMCPHCEVKIFPPRDLCPDCGGSVSPDKTIYQSAKESEAQKQAAESGIVG